VILCAENSLIFEERKKHVLALAKSASQRKKCASHIHNTKYLGVWDSWASFAAVHIKCINYTAFMLLGCCFRNCICPGQKRASVTGELCIATLHIPNCRAKDAKTKQLRASSTHNIQIRVN